MEFIDPKIDFAFKKIFGAKDSKPILISFLNALIYEGQATIEDLEIIDPYQAREVATLKDSYLDVKAKLNNGTVVIIEMQVVYKIGFEKRILYNAAKAYSSELVQGQNYREITPVIALSIIDFILFKNTQKIISRFVLREAEEGWEYIYPGLTLIFAELPKLKKSLEALETLGDKWLYFMQQAPKLRDVPESLKQVPEIQSAFTAANRMNLTSEEFDRLQQKSFYIQDQQFLREENERLLAERDRIITDQERIMAEKERIMAEKERIMAEKERVMAEKEQISAEKEQISAEKEQISAEKEQISAEKEQISAEKEQISAEKDHLQESNQQLQETLEETRQQPKNLLIRQLTRRFGALEDSIQIAIQQLSNQQLESLGEAVFDFRNQEDLRRWLGR